MRKQSFYRFLTNPCSIYLIVCLLYSLQGTGFYDLGQISIVLHIILICMSAYYFVYAISSYKLPPFLNATSVLLIITVIYTLFRFFSGDVVIDNTGREIVPTETIRSMYPLLSIFAFYVFGRKGYLNEEMLKKWVFVFLGCAILSIYGLQMSYIEKLGEANIGDYTNSMGYSMLSIIPAVGLFKRKPIIQFALLLVIDFFVFISMKRGAMLIGAICTLYFLYQSIKLNKRNQYVIIFTSAIVIYGILYFFKLELSTNDYFLSRVEMTQDGDSSERNLIYGSLLSIFVDQSNVFEQLFGHGLDGCVKCIGIMAHNDWIEFLIDFGIMGVILLLWFFLSLFKTTKKIQAINTELFVILGLSTLLLLFRTFFSMSITVITYYTSTLMGFALSYYHTNSNTQTDEQNKCHSDNRKPW